jgi:hypothetical protein
LRSSSIGFSCIAGWRVAYPAYGFVLSVLPDGALLIRPTGSFCLYCRMARGLSGLRIRFVCIAGWRDAYPAYGFVLSVLPDGASLIRPTDSFRLYCRMARCLSGVVVL